MTLTTIFSMAPGSLRRKKIIAWLEKQEILTGLPVNNKYQFNIEKDRDLQVLLKKNIVKRVRVGSGFRNPGRGSEKKQTYLVLA